MGCCARGAACPGPGSGGAAGQLGKRPPRAFPGSGAIGAQPGGPHHHLLGHHAVLERRRGPGEVHQKLSQLLGSGNQPGDLLMFAQRRQHGSSPLGRHLPRCRQQAARLGRWPEGGGHHSLGRRASLGGAVLQARLPLRADRRGHSTAGRRAAAACTWFGSLLLRGALHPTARPRLHRQGQAAERADRGRSTWLSWEGHYGTPPGRAACCFPGMAPR